MAGEVCRWWVVVPECADSIDMKLDERGTSGPWVKWWDHRARVAALEAERDEARRIAILEAGGTADAIETLGIDMAWTMFAAGYAARRAHDAGARDG